MRRELLALAHDGEPRRAVGAGLRDGYSERSSTL
jgi:hypothetical protein